MAVVSNPSLLDSCNVSGEEDELERLAVEELVNEAKRAKERSQTMGTYGWQKRKTTTNKRFLHNTLVSTLREYKTHSRYHRKSYSHDSRTTESKWSKSDDNGVNSQLVRDAILIDESNLNSKSRKDSAAEDNESGEGNVLRLACDEGGSSKGKEQELGHMSTGHAGPRNYHDHHHETKGNYKKRSRSRSPLKREPNNGQSDDHEMGHHGNRDRGKRSKHNKKSKHKEMHTRDEGHKIARRQEKIPLKSPVQ